MKKFFFLLLLFVSQHLISLAQPCPKKTIDDDDLDCSIATERSVLVGNHCLTATQFKNMIYAKDYPTIVLAGEIKTPLQKKNSSDWLDCEQYTVQILNDNESNSSSIRFNVIEINRHDTLIQYYKLGLFVGLCEKYPRMEKIAFYRGNKKNLPFLLTYIDGTGKEAFAYYDYSEGEPTKKRAKKH